MSLCIFRIISCNIITFTLLCANILFAQYHPPIQNFPPELYQAGNQNWKIAQDDYNRTYVANNFGLLEFNGTSWKLHPTPNNTIMRSVFVSNNAIYTGSYMDFGYWLRQADGQLEYTSLVESLNFDMLEDEQVWQILSHKQFILFQSLNRLIIYDQLKRSLRVFTPVSGIFKVFISAGNIYYQDNNLSLYQIENEKSQLFIRAEKLNNNQVSGIVDTPNGELIVSRNNGLWRHSNGNLTPLNNALGRVLSNDVIFCFTQTNDGQLVLGSIKNGVYILSHEGQLVQHIATEEGLLNNTVLAVFADAKNGLWLGLDNGLSYVHLDSPKQFYSLRQEPIGTVYATQIFNGNLYVGTNQGLYQMRLNSSEPLKPVPGLDGQVWSLQLINGILLCGHDKGAFEINASTVKPLYKGAGVWLFRTLNNNKLLAGSYNGLHLFEKDQNSWRYITQVQNFSMSSRYVELVDSGEILVSHEYKGVFKLTLNNNNSAVIDISQVPDVPTSLYASMVSFQGDVCYFSKGGFYNYNVNTNRFTKNEGVSSLFKENNFTSAKMVVDREKYLWLFERNNLIRVEKGALSNEYIVNKFPLSYDLRKTNTGFENISHVAQDEYLVGSANGFFVFNTSKIQTYAPEIMFDALTVSSKNNQKQQIDFRDDIKLPSNFNNISASYFIANNDIADRALFQYKLEGYSDNWSEWSENATVSYSNLKFGTYTLTARAMVGDVISTKAHEITFKIQRPWYFSSPALLGYAALMILLFRLVNNRYTNYYRSEQEKLIEENKRKLNLMALKQNEEIMRIKNEQLQDNIEQKNKELAISTMAMIKKNQFMNALLNDLEPAAEHPTVSRVVRTIKRSLKNDDDWEFFEQAFDNADKDFLKRLKELHASLTNHDLKLCAYLRLNLSSKEIAPLLNISVKSVDIKRYRLRKKMDLDHNQNLTEYILSL